jgi:hypothetical protein
MTTTEETPQTSITPSAVSVMGAGQEIRNINELDQFHTPSTKDGGNRNYHTHKNLISHYAFANIVLNHARQRGLIIDDVAFKVDKVVDDTIKRSGFFGCKSVEEPVRIAQRFFLIARIRNPEFQLADDVETFLIARNSHDKQLPMEVAIGNKVIVCSNLMFGGDIAIKAKNSPNGTSNLTERLEDLLTEYLDSVGRLKNDVEYFKAARISEAAGLAFIGKHATEAAYIQPSRTADVCDMFINPEHASEYQNEDGEEKYTLWRLLNAYTYVHRGELVIDPDTGSHHPDMRRRNVCPLALKKTFTKKLWDRLRMRNDDINATITRPWWKA